MYLKIVMVAGSSSWGCQMNVNPFIYRSVLYSETYRTTSMVLFEGGGCQDDHEHRTEYYHVIGLSPIREAG